MFYLETHIPNDLSVLIIPWYYSKAIMQDLKGLGDQMGSPRTHVHHGLSVLALWVQGAQELCATAGCPVHVGYSEVASAHWMQYHFSPLLWQRKPSLDITKYLPGHKIIRGQEPLI